MSPGFVSSIAVAVTVVVVVVFVFDADDVVVVIDDAAAAVVVIDVVVVVADEASLSFLSWLLHLFISQMGSARLWQLVFSQQGWRLFFPAFKTIRTQDLFGSGLIDFVQNLGSNSGRF